MEASLVSCLQDFIKLLVVSENFIPPHTLTLKVCSEFNFFERDLKIEEIGIDGEVCLNVGIGIVEVSSLAI